MGNHLADSSAVGVNDLLLSDVEQKEVEKAHIHDSVARYLSDIARTKLLTAEEEIELSRRVLEESDEEAKQILVTRNLLLVIRSTRQFLWSSLPIADLIQEGNLGLMIAAEKFDARIARFSTYATWWINSSIRRAIMSKSGIIRTQPALQRLQWKIIGAQNELSETGTRTATISSIAKKLGVTNKEIEDAIALQINMVSLDAQLGAKDDEDATLEDFLLDNTSLAPDSMAEAEEQLALCCNSLNLIFETASCECGIKERDISILKHRYGLNSSTEPLNLDEVSEIFGVSRERVRQITENIWNKLQQNGLDFNETKLKQLLERIWELEKLTGTLVKFKD